MKIKTKNNHINKIQENTLLWIAFCISLAESMKFIFIENNSISFDSIISYLPFCLIAGLVFTIISNIFDKKNKAHILFNITISRLSSVALMEIINTVSAS